MNEIPPFQSLWSLLRGAFAFVGIRIAWAIFVTATNDG